jgi:hypothetical protein
MGLASASYSPQEITLSEIEKKQILNYVRLIYENKVDQAKALKLSPKLLKLKAPVILFAFSDEGRLEASFRQDDMSKGFKQGLKIATAKLKMQSSKNVTKKYQSKFLKGFKGKISQYKTQPDYLHVMVVSYTGKLINFGIKGIFDNKVYEPHVTGLVYELNGKRQEINPLESLIGNLGPKGARNYLAKQLEIDAKKMPGNNDLKLEIYRVIHFGERFPDGKFTNYHRGHEYFTAKQVGYEELLKRLKLIGEWYSNNVKKGEVVYEYHPATGTYDDSKRTMVRSTMSVWVLNRLAVFLKDDKLKKLGKETLDFYLERFFQMKASKVAGKIIPSTVPLKKSVNEIAKNRYTAASFLVAAILERGAFAEYKQEVELLVDWFLKYQREDGVFKTQFGQSQYFMPGQLLLAVAYLYEETKDQKYLKFFEKSYAAYERSLKDMMHLGPKHYAPYAPAWFTQPVAKMYELTKDKKYRDMVFLINDRVEKWYELNTENAAYFDYDGILAPKAGHYGNNSVTAAALESLADAAYVAKLSGDTQRFQKYSKVVKQTTAYLMRLQYTPANTYHVRKRSRVVGGFKTDLVNTKVWMDNVWHLTSAFMKIYNHKLLP